MAGGAVEGAVGNVPDDYFIDREEFLKELLLREAIRNLISESEKEEEELFEQENVLRSVINKLITEAETDTTPHASTAINFLEDLLKKILPGIEQDYKSLTTKKEQRDSFRAQLTSSISTVLDTAELNIQGAEQEGGEGAEEFIDIEEDIEIAVTDDEKFIDIEGTPEEDEEGDETADEEANSTGSKLAAQSFDAIEKQILETYSTLSDDEDQQTFRDYLITNIKLYFDKWEKELGDVVEPTTDEYEEEKVEGEDEEGGEELGGEEDFGGEEEAGDEELDLEL